MQRGVLVPRRGQPVRRERGGQRAAGDEAEVARAGAGDEARLGAGRERVDDRGRLLAVVGQRDTQRVRLAGAPTWRSLRPSSQAAACACARASASSVMADRVAEIELVIVVEHPVEVEPRGGRQVFPLDDPRRVLVPGDQRREREEQLVDEVAGEQRAVERGSALAQQRADAARAQVAQRCRRVGGADDLDRRGAWAAGRARRRCRSAPAGRRPGTGRRPRGGRGCARSAPRSASASCPPPPSAPRGRRSRPAARSPRRAACRCRSGRRRRACAARSAAACRSRSRARARARRSWRGRRRWRPCRGRRTGGRRAA